MDVVPRLDLGSRGRAGFGYRRIVEGAAGDGSFCAGETDRVGSDRERREAGRRYRTVREIDRNSDAGDRKIALPPCELPERAPGRGREHREDHMGEDLALFERVHVGAREERGSTDGPLSVDAGGHHGGVDGQGDGRQFGCRIGMSNTAADRPASPNLAMPDERHRQAQQLAALDPVPLHTALGDGGADQPVRLPALHPLELTDGTDVDEDLRAGQPVVEHGNKALAPGQRSRVLAVLGQHS